MVQMNRSPRWFACVLFLLAASAADAGDVNLTCPAQADPGQSVTVSMSFSNTSCSAESVRVMSSIVGNASGTLAGVGIYGPEVAVPIAVVPAGTARYCGCVSNACECQFGPAGPLACSTDADCSLCVSFTPGVLELMVDTTVIPPTLSGTVATHILISEFDSGTKIETEIDECFVEVLPFGNR